MKKNTRQYLDNLGIETLTPMQDEVLAQFPNNKDLVVLSPTGSGKTLAFLLPVLEMLDENMEGIQAVIISPTRELALQIEDVFKKCKTNFKINITYGGHSMRTEKQSLTVEPTVLVATPGRLCDHLNKGTVQLDRLKCIVLDEFDKSLEMGFQNEMGYIIEATPKSIKTILSSATSLDDIPKFTGIENPKWINFLNELKPELTLKKVIYGEEEKLPKLFELICSLPNEATLIFCNHRDACIRICEHLQEMGIPALPFHGAMEQPDRERSLIRFRNGSANYLVATDLAARGLDIPDIGTVIHYQMPQKIDSFTHRNGRTARMMEKGQAILFQEEGRNLPLYIEKEIAEFKIKQNSTLPDWPSWDTIYFSGGKKEKINKIDLVGFLIQKGELQKEEIGLITVVDHWSYVAVKADKIKDVIHRIRQEKIKGKRLKIELSR
jgi:superfamily II DNA/RNA helicase